MDLWHALNRGVEKRNIFLDTQDYARFVHDMYEFNDTAPAQEFSRRNVGPRRSHIKNRIVDIHGWCLMRNHYHLLLSEIIEGGISKFLMRLNVGYAKYFNTKYERNGYVFSGKTKKILIENDAQFNYILHYIHLNPLDYLKGGEGWRVRDKGKNIRSVREALDYLKEYRWSSYPDYIGEQNFPSILTTSLFGEASGQYKKTIERYLKGAENKGSETDFLNLE